MTANSPDSTMDAQPRPLQGKVAIVTGASRGIGKGIATVLAREGAAVVVVARTERPGRLPGTIHETADAITERGGVALAVRCDVTQEQDVQAMAQQTLDRFGRIDLLVNNAGGSSTFEAIERYPLHRFDRVVALNIRGTFLCSQAVLPAMAAQGSGVIVNISSDSGARLAFPNDTVYGMVKAAVERFGLGLAHEVKRHNIAVFSLLPGKVKTEGAEAIHPPDFDWAGWVEPEEVGPAVAWLALQSPSTFVASVVSIDELGKGPPPRAGVR